MATILAAIGLAAVIALAAGGGYYLAQEPVYRAQPGPSVRVGDPGHNLVGQNWSGDPTLSDIRKDAGASAKAETKNDS